MRGLMESSFRERESGALFIILLPKLGLCDISLGKRNPGLWNAWNISKNTFNTKPPMFCNKQQLASPNSFNYARIAMSYHMLLKEYICRELLPVP